MIACDFQQCLRIDSSLFEPPQRSLQVSDRVSECWDFISP